MLREHPFQCRQAASGPTAFLAAVLHERNDAKTALVQRRFNMPKLRLAYQYAAVLLVVAFCKPAEAEQKVTLSSLIGNGFEIKGTLSFSGINMILVQKDKDAFACNIFQSKDGSYMSTCFPIR
jgi:hypothetical protein